MIDIDKFPSSDFTVDEMVERNFDRQEIVASLRRMEQNGKGTFVIGRRGGKSRFEWKKDSPQTTYEPPQNSWSHIQAEQHRKDYKNLADIIGFRGTPTPVAVYEHVSGLMKELKYLRDKPSNVAVMGEPPGIKHVPLEWLTETPLENGLTQIGWSFWNEDQREQIAAELLSYRRGK